jgi:glutamate 5-kinase
MFDAVGAKKIVVKVGSSTLTHKNGKLNFARIDLLVRTLSDLKGSGKEVILVSSGAIAVGVSRLGLSKKPSEMRQKQAAAAIGQCELMYLYDKLFREYGHITAQVLLTKDIINDKERKTNVINTFQTLLDYEAVPIVNENDTVSYEEIEFGDNDTLAAIVAVLVDADLLILLSDIDGLYDKNPRQFKNATLIPVVSEINDEIRSLGGAPGSDMGTGGMSTKITSGEIATSHGIDMIIANGENPSILYDIFKGKPVGTVFLSNRHRSC